MLLIIAMIYHISANRVRFLYWNHAWIWKTVVFLTCHIFFTTDTNYYDSGETCIFFFHIFFKDKILKLQCHLTFDHFVSVTRWLCLGYLMCQVCYRVLISLPFISFYRWTNVIFALIFHDNFMFFPIWQCLHPDNKDSQIAIDWTSIQHFRIRCLIDIDPRVFVIGVAADMGWTALDSSRPGDACMYQQTSDHWLR